MTFDRYLAVQVFCLCIVCHQWRVMLTQKVVMWSYRECRLTRVVFTVRYSSPSLSKPLASVVSVEHTKSFQTLGRAKAYDCLAKVIESACNGQTSIDLFPSHLVVNRVWWLEIDLFYYFARLFLMYAGLYQTDGLLRNTRQLYPGATALWGSYTEKIAAEWRVSHTAMILNSHNNHSFSWHPDQSAICNSVKRTWNKQCVFGPRLWEIFAAFWLEGKKAEHPHLPWRQIHGGRKCIVDVVYIWGSNLCAYTLNFSKPW